MSPQRVIRKLALIVALCGATVALSATTAQAVLAAPPPTVSATLFSPLVRGNVGTPASGISVAVALVRQGDVVATSPTATTDGDGAWDATLPSHTLSNAADVLRVDYDGPGAPADAVYSFAFSIDEELFNGFPAAAYTAPDGNAITIYCQTCASPTIRVHVEYAGGGVADVNATSSSPGASTAALSPAVGPEDVVTYTTTFALQDEASDPTVLELTSPAGMPGASGPTNCSGNLALGTAVCGGLSAGEYDVTRERAGSPDVTRSELAPYDGGSVQVAFADLKAADELQLRVHGAGAVLTSLRLAGLRVDTTQTDTPFPFPFFGQLTTTGGSCPAGTWLQAPFFFGEGVVCPSDGVMPANLSGVAQSRDDLSPGTTATTPATLLNTSPLDGENVYGTSVVAFADSDQPNATVGVSFGPRGGARTAATGNANSPAGAVMSAIAAGTRYTATWTATDANGDTSVFSTAFNGQAGASGPSGSPGATGPAGSAGQAGASGTPGSPGATGPAGSAGPAGRTGATGATGATGPRGATGPQGPAGPSAIGIGGVNVTCKLVKKGGKVTGTKCKATVVRTRSSARSRVALRIYRGATVYAMGSGVLKSRSGSFGLVQRRKLTRGLRYGMTIVLTGKGGAKTAVGRVRVR